MVWAATVRRNDEATTEMANIPQKSPNSTEEALIAIREALGTNQSESHAAPPNESDLAQTEPSATADLFNEEPQPGSWDSDATLTRLAANDDRASLGQMLQAIHGRPARMPYIVASVAAFIWTVGGLATAFLYGGELQALFATPRIGFAAMIGLASAIAVPVIFFYVLAHMFRRSQDLRLVAETMAEVAMRLTQPEAAAREQVVTVGQAIRREVAAMGDGVERALARAAELESLVHNEVSALERAYNDNEVRIRDLLSELTNQRETLVNQAEHVRNAIASVHLDLSHDITSVGDLVSDKVNEVAQRVTRSLTEKGEHITMALGHVGDSMIGTLTERGSTMLDRLETTGDRASTAILSASDQLTNSLNFKSEHVHEEFADLAARLQQMMSARLDQIAQGFAQKAAVTIETMASRSQAFNDTLTQTGGQMAETIAARAEEVNTTLRSTGDSLVLDLSLRGNDVVSKLEQTGARITDTLVSRSDAVADNFRTNAEALAQLLINRGDAVKDMLAARLQAFEEIFNQGGTALSERVSRDATTLGSLITRHIAEFDRTVKTYGGELVERLGQRTQDVSEAMRSYVDTIDQRLTGRASEITGSIDVRLSQFEEQLASRVSDLTARLTDGGKRIVANTLDSRVTRFEDLLIGRAETVTNQLEARTKAAGDALHARLEELGQSIKTNSADAERSLGQLALSTSETLRTSSSEVERTLLGVSAEVSRNIVGKADEIADAVSRRTNEMAIVLSDKSGSVLAAITEKGQQFASDITRASDEALKSIEDKGSGFTRSMLDNSTEMSRMISSAGEAASNTVYRTLNDLYDTAQKAIDLSKSTATATVSEMLETHNMLRTDTTALFERLREANIMLQEVLSGSHANMSALENTLVLRVSEFVTAMNEVTGATGVITTRVETNIADFREVTARVIADLGELASQFNAHGRDLANAAEQIDRSNQRTEDGVTERRATLDSLVTTLDIRTEDLDQRLKRFTGLLDQSLEAASARARDIARVVSESTAEGSRAISEQYERVREHADGERRRTAEAMHSIYDQTAGDTQAMFNDANERFAETVQGMKQMAAEMQRELETTRSEMHRELESTRAELRRGMFELPQETAESTAQMRRVIVDQIEALAELNRIVARHGRHLDAVEPRRPPREETPLAAAGSRGELSSRSDPRTDVGSFAPAARRSEPPSLGPTAGAAGRTGWLTDLLSRASREEGEPERDLPRDTAREALRGAEERTPRHSIESLDSLSVDIARMIDHDAAADLWDRYKRGERNVFTRRLYTLQGQQAFDEIRRKYRADREFKQTVDRYIGEFERLLDEVARDDRGQVVARTYLTSETGKVYTMLAHAAGRFD
jgi:Apolipoprotein A1/A4/E domain